MHLLAGIGPERLFVLQRGDGDALPLRSAMTAPTNLVVDVSASWAVPTT